MKFVAHPLVVAVAMGLLEPGILDVDGRDDADAVEAEPTTLTLDVAPSAEDFARLELEWQSVRELV